METWTPQQYKEHFELNKHPALPHIPTKSKKNNGNKAKAEMELVLKFMGVKYETEFKFHPERKWRADYALPAEKILIEYEGLGLKGDFNGGVEKSGHTSPCGYTKNCDKYNAAATLGYTLLRYTALNYTQMTDDLRKLLKK